jgi:hypothetical protein
MGAAKPGLFMQETRVTIGDVTFYLRCNDLCTLGNYETSLGEAGSKQVSITSQGKPRNAELELMGFRRASGRVHTALFIRLALRLRYGRDLLSSSAWCHLTPSR